MVDYNKPLEQKWAGWRPPPPPVPSLKYDPSEEAPKWSWTRIVYNEPVDKGPIPWTKKGTQPKDPNHPDWRGVIRNNVIEYPMPEPYTFGFRNDPAYFWFDTPDYADPFKKLWYCTKWFFNTGVIGASLIGCIEGRKLTMANNVNLARRFLIPWLAAGLAGGATVITLANLRGKADDYKNYLAAGFVMSCMLWRKDHSSWVRWVLFLPPTAAFFKHNAEINGLMFPRWDLRCFRGSVDGLEGDHGWGSGNLIPNWYPRSNWGDPGRDVRRVS